HARRRVAGKLDPLRIERMKLRMDHRSGKGNQAPSATVRTPDDNAAGFALLDRRRHPLPSRAERALSQLGAVELHNRALRQGRAIDFPSAAAGYEEDALAARVDGGREWVNRRTVGKLADFAVRERRFEQLRAPGPVGREDQRFAIGRK